ncbi:hypothetical protein MJG53_016673 [Ovis ammon polii x Ovis aries]|uniref:Uncharacterized protein n=1 Tax=Ovis ammon polii x Ovis aries TaxID=2918886 RepID=A0ACB9U9K0_9CETA|nr:hypothetical protein MJG53_016673 [Ovis ammon polii x Ovis aries]
MCWAGLEQLVDDQDTMCSEVWSAVCTPQKKLPRSGGTEDGVDLKVLGFLLCWEKQQLYLHWYHKVFSPYIHLSSISVMVLLSWPVAFYLIHLEGEALQVAIGVPFFLILLCLYVVPFGTYSPCLQEKEKLAPKPTFFGHRGAPMLGPENTIMSFEKAVEYGAHGLESDVRISFDGVPFLMHDYDLTRTTNIKEVLPNASSRHPSLFQWSFLTTLNAGKWFSDAWIKPFFRMKPLSEADKERARNQKIAKLTDLLAIAQKEKKLVIFDLESPPSKHPSRLSYIHLVVRVILDSKIEQHLIAWLPGSEREYIKSKAPGFQHVGTFYTLEELAEENITRINVDYKRLYYNGLREYKAANISINLYIVNEPWLFSLVWCHSIQSVTTDNIEVLNGMTHPYYFMTPNFYLFLWIFMDILSAVFIVSIFHFHWWRESQSEKILQGITSYTALQVAIGLPFVLILLCLCVVPFGIYSPCVQEKDKLGPKPNFFGHRGAPMLGPENTIMSFEKAVEYGAHGLESDVQISLDKVPFLMHDYDLRRTTNILDVMPNASHEHSSFFNWDFLSTLNAGKWFSDSWIKPFFRMKPLSEADKERARNQKIPKLSELLELAQKEKKLVIFDLNAPPQSHPSRSSYIRLVVSVILDSKIEQHLIIWLPGSDRKYVRSKAPGFQHIGRLFTIEELRKENITRINVDYKRLFYNGLKEYKAANITINLYIINEPWLFSLAWCSRIHSVTTDNIQVLKKINHPYYFMTPKFYLFMWIFMDILAAVFIVAVFHFYWKRESQSEKILHGITSYTETPSTSLHDEVLEVVEIPGLLTKSDSEVIISEVVNETTAPTVYPTDDVGQLVPTEPAFEPIQAPTSEANREATLQTVLLTLEANEPTVPFVEKPPPEM